MRLGSRNIELARQRIDSIKEYARKHGNFGAIKQLALAPKSIGRKFATAFVIAAASMAFALLAATVPPLSRSMSRLDDAFYDSFYKSRKAESKLDSNTVIVVVDDKSVKQMIADL